MPAWMTPLERPVWWAAIRGSRSSTTTPIPSWRNASSRATASPTIPAPMTTTSHSRGGSGSLGTMYEFAGLSLANSYTDDGPAAEAAGLPPARAPAEGAADRAGVGLRAEVRRLPGARVRRRRAPVLAVAKRPAAGALLPRAAVPARPLHPRRRARDRGLRRPRGVRCAPEPHPSGAIADRAARRRDAGCPARVRRPRLRRPEAPHAAVRRPARGARAVARGCRRSRERQAHAARRRARRRGAVANRGRGGDREAARCAVPPWRAQGDGEGGAAWEGRLRGRWVAAGG